MWAEVSVVSLRLPCPRAPSPRVLRLLAARFPVRAPSELLAALRTGVRMEAVVSSSHWWFWNRLRSGLCSALEAALRGHLIP